MERKRLTLKDRRELVEFHFHGEQMYCYNCQRKTNDIEWHHIVPVYVGGSNNFTNFAPLCHACHTAITMMKPVQRYAVEAHKNPDVISGRKAQYPPHYEEVFEDFVRCRISTRQAMFLLGKDKHFREMKWFRELMDENGIKAFKNDIDMILFRYNRFINLGMIVGYIEYKNGTVEQLRYGIEEPLCKFNGVEVDEYFNSIKKTKKIKRTRIKKSVKKNIPQEAVKIEEPIKIDEPIKTVEMIEDIKPIKEQKTPPINMNDLRLSIMRKASENARKKKEFDQKIEEEKMRIKQQSDAEENVINQCIENDKHKLDGKYADTKIFDIITMTDNEFMGNKNYHSGKCS